MSRREIRHRQRVAMNRQRLRIALELDKPEWQLYVRDVERVSPGRDYSQASDREVTRLVNSLGLRPIEDL